MTTRPVIKDDIARELSEQVKAQVQIQVKQYLPMSFEEQLNETKEHTTLIKDALKNSWVSVRLLFSC